MLIYTDSDSNGKLSKYYVSDISVWKEYCVKIDTRISL